MCKNIWTREILIRGANIKMILIPSLILEPIPIPNSYQEDLLQNFDITPRLRIVQFLKLIPSIQNSIPTLILDWGIILKQWPSNLGIPSLWIHLTLIWYKLGN